MKKNVPGLLLSGLLAASLFSNTALAQRTTGLEFTSAHEDRVTAPIVLPATGPFTLEAWVNYADASYRGNFNTILEFGDDESYFGVLSDGELTFFSTVGGGRIPTNRWVHVAYTWDGTTSRVFLNGTQLASSANAPGRSTAPLGIGYNDGDTGWQGYIADVMVWSTARTPAEIQADRQLFLGNPADLPATTAGLLAYYKLNTVGAGQTLVNSAPGGPAGVLGVTAAAELTDPALVAISPNSARRPAAEHALQSAAPNPFTESTTLHFTMPAAGRASAAAGR